MSNEGMEPLSEAARERLAAIAAKEARGEKVGWTDIIGILEPNPDLSNDDMIAELVKRGFLSIDTRTLDDGMAGATTRDGALVQVLSKPNTIQARLVSEWGVLEVPRDA